MGIYKGTHLIAGSTTDKANIDLTNLSTTGESHFVNSTQLTAAISATLAAIYPVGAIYIGTTATCPMAALITDSVWTLVSQDRVLQGAGTRGTVGTTIAESLPHPNLGTTGSHQHSGTTGNVSANHTHSRGTMEISGNVYGIQTYGGTGSPNGDGALRGWRTSAAQGFWDGTDNASVFNLDFYASRNWPGATSGISANHTHSITVGANGDHTHTIQDSTYQANAPVQQNAYLVNVWERTA